MVDIEKELNAIKEIVGSLEKIEEDRRQYILKYATEAVNIPQQNNLGRVIEPKKEQKDHTNMTLTEFIESKKPKNNYQLIACLGYYLEYNKQVKEFGAKEIREANSEARLPPISNLTRDIQNTQRQYNFIIPAKNKKKTLSSSGKGIVEALPDQIKAQEIMKGARPKLKKKASRAVEQRKNEDQ